MESTMTYAEYKAMRLKIFKQLEGNFSNPYLDTKEDDPQLTIGIGFNIEDNENLRNLVYEQLGLTEATDPGGTVRKLLNDIINNDSLTAIQIQEQLNDTLQKGLKDESKTFSLTDAQIETIFNEGIEKYEAVIDKFLYLQERVEDEFGVVPDPEFLSPERVALLSVHYTNVIKWNAEGAPTLRNDMATDNRADAWYQIRYDSNKNIVHDKRRYIESQIFGLFSNPQDVSEQEAKNAVDVYLKYYDADIKNNIKDYEALHQHRIDDADVDLKAAGVKDADGNYLQVDTIGQIFKPIADYLYEQYVSKADVDAYNANVGQIDFIAETTGDVVLGHETTGSDGTFIQPVYRWLYGKSPKDGEALPAGITGNDDMLIALDDKGYNLQGLFGDDILIGGAQDDTLYGGYKDTRAESGDDVLIGGDGNDSLYGGDGDDVLRGGAGVDHYYFERNDGTDKIIDADGQGTIHVKNTASQSEFNVLGSASGGTLTHSDLEQFVGSYWEMDAQGNLLTQNRYVPYFDTETNSYTLKVIVDEQLQGDGAGQTAPANVIWIKNWNNGDFGLTIPDLPPPENLPEQTVAETLSAPLIAFCPKPGRVFDPLTFDLNNDGKIGTRSVVNGVYFDLDNSGFAEKTSWVSAEDGLLVLDRNNNGFIDGGAELFGSETLLENGNKAANGFEALAEFDSNGDQKIDSADAQFNTLRIWKDANSNGIADAGEMQSLSAAGIASINLDYTSDSFTDKYRVEHREQGQFTRMDSTTGITNTLWFNRDARQSVAVSELQGQQIIIPADILTLPNVAGSGNLHSLHEAMVLDTTGQLKQAVTQFAQTTDIAARRAMVNDILLLWTKQGAVLPESRGEFVDAQHLAVLEQFWGEPAGVAQPAGQTAVAIENIYQQLEQAVYSQLMQGSHAKDQISQIQFTREGAHWQGDFTLVSQALVNRFVQNDPAATLALKDFMEVVKGFNPYDLNSLYDDFTQSVADAAKGVPQATRETILQTVRSGHDFIVGTETGEVIAGYAGNDTVYAAGGNDQVLGHDGADNLHGEGGDDVVDGGLGNDRLYGGGGSDTYHYQRGDGIDFIQETSGFDTLQLGQGIDSTSVRLLREGNDLRVMLDENNSIYVVNMFIDGSFDQSQSIERIQFGNNEAWDLARIRQELLQGRSGDDEIFGFDTGDVIVGAVGNDVLVGHNGDDTYHYQLGDGTDVIIDIAGADKLVLGAAIAPEQVVLARSHRDLVINVGGSGSITVQGMFSTPDGGLVAGNALERIEFANGVTWDIATIQQSVLSVNGTGGNDFLVGSWGDDTLTGARGNDTVKGSIGNDVYRYDRGDGNDVIDDESGFDTLMLGTGIKAQDVNINHLGNDLVFDFSDGGKITVINAFVDGSTVFLPNTLESIGFHDGVTWDLTKIFNETLKIKGTWNADTIQGTSGNNILVGRGGNDVILGGSGDDRYEYHLGDGDDVIEDESGTDIVDLGQSITPDMIDVFRSNNNLLIAITGSGIITVKNAFSSSDNTFTSSAIEFIRFSDSSAWDGARIQAELQNTGVQIGDTVQGTPNPDSLTGTSANNLLIGGLGNDVLNGLAGHDTYLFNRGDGSDTINETAGLDVIQFGEEITQDDIQIRREGGDLTIAINGTKGVTVRNMFIANSGVLNPNNAIEQIEFSNGDVMTLAQIKQAAITTGTGWGNLYGYETDDVITGGRFSEQLWGYDGNDTLIGGESHDDLIGGNGDDVYILRPGDGEDFITESGGRNIIQFEDYVETDENGNVVYRERIEESDVRIFKEYTTQLRVETGYGTSVLLFSMFDHVTGALKNDAIHAIRFSNGVEWDYARIQQEILRYTDGSDHIEGFDRDNNLYGGLGSDTLVGTSYNDSLTGGKGSDTLEGRGGNDSYFYELGDGVDQIYAGNGVDTLVLGEGIDPLAVSAAINSFGTGIILVISEQGKITLMSMLDAGTTTINSSSAVDFIQFHNGDVWTAEQLLDKAKNPGPIVIQGNEYNNTLEGTSANDIIIGGKGNDILRGTEGNDTYIFSDADYANYSSDWIEESGSGLDAIKFASGITEENVVVRFSSSGLSVALENGDHPIGSIFVDRMYNSGVVGNGIERIEFSNGNSWDLERIKIEALKPTDGNDFIYAYNTDDVLAGGKGADDIVGQQGNDTYLFNKGDGDDNFLDSGGIDSIHLGQGIASGDVIVRRSGFFGEDLTLNFGSGDEITIVKALSPAGDVNTSNVIETVKFSSGETWDMSRLVAESIKGSDKSDIIFGYATNDVIHGGKGFDQLYGYQGNDTYQFAKGDGIGIIREQQGVDTIEFLPGIAPADLIVGRVGVNLVLHTIHGEEVIVADMFTSVGAIVPGNAIEQIKFADGSIWNTQKILEEIALTEAKADIKLGTNNNDALIGTIANDRLFGENGNDILDGKEGHDVLLGGMGNDDISGGSGNDTLNGGYGINFLRGNEGSDTFLVADDAGWNILDDFSFEANEKIVFSDAIRPEDVRVSIEGSTNYSSVENGQLYIWPLYDAESHHSLVLTIGDSTRNIEVRNVFTWDTSQNGASVSQPEYLSSTMVEFAADGTTWTLNDLLGYAMNGSGYSATQRGTAGNDTINGLAGDDSLYGYRGNDNLAGGVGNDSLHGGYGDDIYHFDAGFGNDVIYDLHGNDKIQFGAAINPADIVISRDINSLVFTLPTGATLTILDVFVDTTSMITTDKAIESVEFANNTVWNLNKILHILEHGNDGSDPELDTTAPAIPEAAFDVNGQTITGMAEQGSLVVVKNATGSQLGNAIADATTGAYSITLTTALINKETVNVTATDAAGNVSSTRAIIAPDKTPPAMPTASFDTAGQVISGTAEAGSTVIVKNTSGAQLGSVTANATTGAYSITLATALINKETVNITATDTVGNVSSIRAVVAPDKTPPAMPTASFDTAGQIIGGTAEAGSTVIVKNTTGTQLGTATANATTGAYTITLTTALINKETVNVTATDVAGNVSSIRAVVAPDKTPPAMPTASFNTAGQIISGTAEAGSTVIVKNTSGTQLGTATANTTTGAYTITLATALINKETVNVTATDVAGNVSSVREVVAPDNTPPAMPTASFDTAGQVISGTAEVGSTVVVKNGGNTATLGTAVANASGAYSVTLPTALTNNETVNVTAADAAGNVSTALAVVAPSIVIPNPTSILIQAENFTSMSGVQNETTTDTGGGQNVGWLDAGDWMSYNNAAFSVPVDGRYTITYRVASLNGGGTLNLRELSNDSLLDSVNIPKTNSWQSWVDVTKEINLTAGVHNFKLVVGTGGFNINWFKLEPMIVDTTPPAQPSAAFDASGKVITGIAEVGSTVEVKNASSVLIGSATADAITGAYTITLATALINKESVNVTAKDSAGNVSEVKAIVAPDLTPPVQPSAAFDTAGKVVSGTAEAGSVVEIRNSTNTAILGTATANATTGSYSITVATALLNGETVNVTAKDAVGNVSVVRAVNAPDVTAPSQPTAAFDTAGKVITGVAEVGSTVVVKNSGNTATLGTAVANASGAYSVTLPTALTNNETVSVTAADAAGNVSAALAVVAPSIVIPNPTSILIQAENFTSMNGVQNEMTTDAGGGQNVGWLDAGDWMSYNNAAFSVPIDGRYTITYRVASLNGGGTLNLRELSNDSLLDSVNIPKTNSWQSWVDVTKEINLTAGVHNFKLVVGIGGFNINWFKLEPMIVDTTPPAQPSAAFDVSGKVITGIAEVGSTIEVKNASSALIGSATADTATGAYTITLATALINKESVSVTAKDSAGNVSAALAVVAPSIVVPNPTSILIQAENFTSMSGVQNETTTDTGGGQNVGWLDAGDWMSYNNAAFSVPADGLYKITYRVASLNGGGTLNLRDLSNDSLLDSVNIPKTNSWQSWVDVTKEINLTAGVHNFKLVVGTGGFNINWFKLEPMIVDTTPPAQPSAAFDASGKVITGIAEVGSTVEVKNASSALIGSATADTATGAYTITLATALTNKQTVNVTARDAAGNVSQARSITAPQLSATVKLAAPSESVLTQTDSLIQAMASFAPPAAAESRPLVGYYDVNPSIIAVNH